MKHYKAHWDALLISISLLLTLVCVVIAVFALRHPGASFWVGLLLIALLSGCALFTIRGYAITPDEILVQRLFWATRLPRRDLRAAQFQPDAMRWSLRVFGNGGLFSFSGYYRNRSLGAYRAFVTDRHLTVVLRYSARTVVISPAEPDEFVRDLSLQPDAT